MNNKTYPTLHYLVFALSLLVLGASFYLQYIKGFDPCPLCLMQRLCVIFITLISAIGLYRQKSDRRKSLMITQLVLVGAGLFFAIRQLWLQSLPGDQIPACLPGLSVLIHYFPWQNTVHALFWGSGDCTKIEWTLFGLSLPMWSAFYFLCIGCVNSFLLYLLDRTK